MTVVSSKVGDLYRGSLRSRSLQSRSTNWEDAMVNINKKVSSTDDEVGLQVQQLEC